MGAQAVRFLADYVYGGRPGCGSTESQWTAADWDDWKMVTIRKPRPGEERTVFWDLPKLRTATELVASTPRVGFMTTPAFFANWATNASNSYRVTTNQALIVALGKSFDDATVTVQIAETSSDEKHIEPGTTCYGCHYTLDPMRDFFRASYAIPYFNQYNATAAGVQGTFSVDGVASVQGNGIAAFGKALVTHPRFATAWVQKLCQLANSSPCLANDPEFQRVAEAWRKNKYDYKLLIKDLFSSPLVTFATETKTGKELGTIIGIARREALCAALSHRLKVPDVCALALLPNAPGMPQTRQRVMARNLAYAVPGAGYARGDEQPLMPHDPNLFFHSGTENLCLLLARQMVGAMAPARYRPAQTNEAVADFVATIMGLPSGDPRSAPMGQILREHNMEGARGGASALEALQSTFVLACQSPLAISAGL